MTSESPHAGRALGLGQATCLIAGAGIGGGVMAVPALAANVGIGPTLVVMAVAYCVTVVLHIMVAELSRRTDYASELLTIFSRHLFGDRVLWKYLFYVLMCLTLICNLAAYIVGSGDILATLLGWPLIACKALFFVFAAVVVALGLRRIAINEVVAVIVMVALLSPLLIGTVALPHHQPWPATHWRIMPGLAVYGMVMFSLSSLFAVPQAASGLRDDRRRLPVAVVLGLLINLVVTLGIVLCVLASSAPVTEVAIIGWSRALGSGAHAFGSLFIVLAMLTTFWSISLQLSDMTGALLHAGRLRAWLVATVPCFIVALLPVSGFLNLMQLAGGATAVIVAVMAVPAYRNATARQPDLLLGARGRAGWLCGTVIAMYLLMAVGSLV